MVLKIDGLQKQLKDQQCDIQTAEQTIEDQENDLAIMREEKNYMTGRYHNEERTNNVLYKHIDELKADLKRVSKQHDDNIVQHAAELDDVKRELNELIEWRKFVKKTGLAASDDGGVEFVEESAEAAPPTAPKKAKRGAAAGGGAAAPRAPKRGKLEVVPIEVDENGSPVRNLTLEFSAQAVKKQQ